ncbi:MAG TPA: DegT/DnrJ/EryC1/StrS family aminotransferase [Ignavibacteriaceae bacterium]|jgi:perosamine synthetase|nr:MAG: putative pyridoxal phosphate-dependent aminotransferase EpsN [Ignavibacteria bacterium ADurb.Bin266]OQY74561.1 MAG: perosamine synthetase [Ignavibacteriales bacterium UTCHB2]HQF43453.1 DegT/DnrJ/EryC1/StrS family aminotransferase [Ignavibacteriaceae bacterium]HQI41200.1 DegT/DnrJ/EryC1/StrS family aminotransferase [Ignavibacteriaceae bacterium]
MSFKYPVYQPSLGEKEKENVLECLNSTWISSKGKFITQFENSFSKYIDVKYSAAVCNGTVAIHVALLALGIGEGDEVIVPSFTYIASVNAIKYTGAKPVFVDSDLTTWQIDPNKIEEKITSKTKAIMVVHLYGQPCEMDSIKQIADRHNLFIVEDCAEAFGSLYKGKHVGTIGDISTFSFFGNKTITTGEGGMVVTNDQSLIEKVIHLKGQGLAKNREYYHDIIGYNYRMTNICAAIGSAQLERADELIEKKIQIAKWYESKLKGLPVVFHSEVGEVRHSFWMISILLKDSLEREKVREHLRLNGIETRPTFHPVHLMPMYFVEGLSLAIAEDLGSRGINLPSYPDLNENDVDYVFNMIKESLK